MCIFVFSVVVIHSSYVNTIVVKIFMENIHDKRKFFQLVYVSTCDLP